MKNTFKYVITAAVAIVVIVAASVFVKYNTKIFAETLYDLNSSITTNALPASTSGAVVNIPASDTAVSAVPSAAVSEVPSASPATSATAAGTDFSITDPSVQTPASEAPASTPTAAPASDAETIVMLNNAVNAMRSTPTFTGIKDQDISIQITDCSVNAAKSIINSVIQSKTGKKTLTFAFANGTATDPEENTPVSPKTAIPPTDKDFTLVAEGIESITSASDGTNTTYTIKMKPESSDINNPAPTYTAQVMDYLDLTSLDISAIDITQADFNYTGSTIDITLDPSGKVIRFHENMPLNGTGAGKMAFVTASASLSGYLDEVWTITY